MASVFEIAKNPTLSKMLGETGNTGNIYEKTMDSSHSMISLSSGIDELTYEMNKKLSKQIADVKKAYSDAKKIYDAASSEMGATDNADFLAKIEQARKMQKGFASLHNQHIESLKGLLPALEAIGVNISEIDLNNSKKYNEYTKILEKNNKDIEKQIKEKEKIKFSKIDDSERNRLLNDEKNYNEEIIQLYKEEEEQRIKKVQFDLEELELQRKKSKKQKDFDRLGKKITARTQDLIPRDLSGDVVKRNIEIQNQLKTPSISQDQLKHNIELQQLQMKKLEAGAISETFARGLTGITSHKETFEKTLKEDKSLKYGSISSSAETTKAFNDLQQYTNEIIRLQIEQGKLNKTNITFIDSVKQIGTDFAKNMLVFRLFGRAIEDVGKILQSFKEYEDLSLSVGVAGGLNLDQINEYRNNVLQFAQGVKFSAVEIMKAQDLVVKTGYNLADSQRIVGAAMKISRVTFESLEESTDLLNKTMLVLDMNSMTASKSAQILNSAIQSTPLSLKSMDVALRQTGSAFGSVIEMTSKSGQALEDYKMTSFETMAALTGALALMGKTGEMSGTALKTITTNIIAPTTLATNKINAEFATKGVKGDNGNVLTMADLGRLFSEDVNKGFEKLSTLYKEGQLSMGGIKAIVGSRNTSTVAATLTMINGDLESLKDGITRQGDLTEQSLMISKTWSEEMSKTVNNMQALRINVLKLADTFTGAMNIINGALRGVIDFTNTSGGSSAILGAGIGILISSTVSLVKTVMPVIQRLGVISTLGKEVVASRVASGIAGVTGNAVEDALVAKALTQQDNLKKAIGNNSGLLATLFGQFKVFINGLKTAVVAFVTSPWGIAAIAIGSIVAGISYLGQQEKKLKVFNDTMKDIFKKMETSSELTNKQVSTSLNSMSKDLDAIGNASIKSSDSVYRLNSSLYEVMQSTNEFSKSIINLSDAMISSNFKKQQQDILDEEIKTRRSKGESTKEQEKQKKWIESTSTKDILKNPIPTKDIADYLGRYKESKAITAESYNNQLKYVFSGGKKGKDYDSNKVKSSKTIEELLKLLGINKNDEYETQIFKLNYAANLQEQKNNNFREQIDSYATQLAEGTQQVTTLLGQSGDLINQPDAFKNLLKYTKSFTSYQEVSEKLGLKLYNTDEENKKGRNELTKAGKLMEANFSSLGVKTMIEEGTFVDTITNIIALANKIDDIKQNIKDGLTSFYLGMNKEYEAIQTNESFTTKQKEEKSKDLLYTQKPIYESIQNQAGYSNMKEYTNRKTANKDPKFRGYDEELNIAKIINMSDINLQTNILSELKKQSDAASQKEYAAIKLALGQKANILKIQIREAQLANLPKLKEAYAKLGVESLKYEEDTNTKYRYELANVNEYSKMYADAIIKVRDIGKSKNSSIEEYQKARINAIMSTTIEDETLQKWVKNNSKTLLSTNDKVKEYQNFKLEEATAKGNELQKLLQENNSLTSLEALVADGNTTDKDFISTIKEVITVYKTTLESIGNTPIALKAYLSNLSEMQNVINLSNDKIRTMGIQEGREYLDNQFSFMESLKKKETLGKKQLSLTETKQSYAKLNDIELENGKIPENKQFDAILAMTDSKLQTDTIASLGGIESIQQKQFVAYRNIKTTELELQKAGIELDSDQIKILIDRNKIMKDLNKELLETTKQEYGIGSSQYSQAYKTRFNTLIEPETGTQTGGVLFDKKNKLYTAKLAYSQILQNSGISDSSLQNIFNNKDEKSRSADIESLGKNAKDAYDALQLVKTSTEDVAKAQENYNNTLDIYARETTAFETDLSKSNRRLLAIETEMGSTTNTQQKAKLAIEKSEIEYTQQSNKIDKDYTKNIAGFEFAKNYLSYSNLLLDKSNDKIQKKIDLIDISNLTEEKELELLELQSNFRDNKNQQIKNDVLMQEELLNLQIAQLENAVALNQLQGKNFNFGANAKIRDYKVQAANLQVGKTVNDEIAFNKQNNEKLKEIENRKKSIVMTTDVEGNTIFKKYQQTEKEVEEEKAIIANTKHQTELFSLQKEIDLQNEITAIINANKELTDRNLAAFSGVFSTVDQFLNTGKIDFKPKGINTMDILSNTMNFGKNPFEQMSGLGKVDQMKKAGVNVNEFANLTEDQAKTKLIGFDSDKLKKGSDFAGNKAIFDSSMMAVSGVIAVAGVVDGFVSRQNVLKAQNSIETLKTEEQILNLRKSGAIFESDRKKIDKELLKNQKQQIDLGVDVANASGGIFERASDWVTGLFGGQGAKSAREKQANTEKNRLDIAREYALKLEEQNKQFAILDMIEQNTRDTVRILTETKSKTQNLQKIQEQLALDKIAKVYSKKEQLLGTTIGGQLISDTNITSIGALRSKLRLDEKTKGEIEGLGFAKFIKDKNINIQNNKDLQRADTYWKKTEEYKNIINSNEYKNALDKKIIVTDEQINISLKYLQDKKAIEEEILKIEETSNALAFTSNFTGMNYETEIDKAKKITDAFAGKGVYGDKKAADLEKAKKDDIDSLKDSTKTTKEIMEKFSITKEEAEKLRKNLLAGYTGTFDELIVSATKSGIDAGKSLGESMYESSISILKGLGSSIVKTIFSKTNTEDINDALTTIGTRAATYIQSVQTANVDDLVKSLDQGAVAYVRGYVEQTNNAKANRFKEQELMRKFYSTLGMSSSDAVTSSGDIKLQNRISSIKEGKGSFKTALFKADITNTLQVMQDEYDNAIANMAITGEKSIPDLTTKVAYESLKMKETLVDNISFGISTAFNADSYEGTFDAFGSTMQTMLKEKVLNNLIDGRFGEQIQELIVQATSAMDTGDLNTLKTIQQTIFSITSAAQLAKTQMSGVMSMFDANSIIDYTDKSRDINFTSASTKDITYAITNNVSVSAGAVIGMNKSEMGYLARELLPYIETAIKNAG